MRASSRPTAAPTAAAGRRRTPSPSRSRRRSRAPPSRSRPSAAGRRRRPRSSPRRCSRGRSRDTLIGLPCSSMRRPSARCATPAFVAAYVVSAFGRPRIADIEEIITRWPEPWARKISMAASDWASAATKLVIAVSRLASNLPVPSGAPLPSPALITIRSIVPKSDGEGPEDLEHLVVVVDVQGPHLDPPVGMRGQDLLAQRLEAVGTSRAQRQVVAPGRELPRHLRTEPGGGAGDQDSLGLVVRCHGPESGVVSAA